MRSMIKTACLALALLLVVGGSLPAAATPLSGGNTIYVVNGVETQFLFDPIVRHDGQLVPTEVVTHLGFEVAESGDRLEVSRGGLAATLTLGRTAAEVNGLALELNPPPVRIGGRPFLPVSLLVELGFEVTFDSNLLYIRDLTKDAGPVEPLSESDWQALKAGRTIQATVRSDDGRWYLPAELTLLSPALVAGAPFEATYRQRAQYLDLLRTHTLLEVKLTNPALFPVTLRPESLSLLDPATGKQYDVQQALPLQGLISQRLVGGATKRSVLVYAPLPEGVSKVVLYGDTNPGALGTFTRAGGH